MPGVKLFACSKDSARCNSNFQHAALNSDICNAVITL